nr:dihydroorotate dehydrogenase electron transfer subunit [Candidatus Njordarchaeota archaeon]
MASTILPRNRPVICRVKSTQEEAEGIKTIRIESSSYICRNAQPGQFLMIWIPGIDEVPMSVSNIEGEDEVWITVKNVGEATSAIHKITHHGLLGLRGPYGTSFAGQGRNVLIVAGGIGAAPLLFLTKRLMDRNRRITAVLGARSAEKLALHRNFEELLGGSKNCNAILATDDGSSGIKGCASDIARDLIKKEDFDRIYTCGPEPMIQKIVTYAHRKAVEVEASLERYMRCGIGLCGSCYIGTCLVCKDGPVFAGGKLKQIAKYLKRE